MRTSNTVGRYGEDLAARYLSTHGFAVLERNWRCELGEIDIVAREGDTGAAVRATVAEDHRHHVDRRT